MGAVDAPEPAYLIETPRLAIRCYERADLEAVHTAILENLEALRPWMPWVEQEPMTREERAALLRSFRSRFDAGTELFYGIFSRADGRCLGGCGIHPRPGAGTVELGYWVVDDRRREGIATEAVAALTQVAFERMEADRVEIRVSPRNEASLCVPRKLGFVEEGTLRGVGPFHEGLRDDLVVFGMLSHELAGSRAAELRVELEGFAPRA